MTTFVKHTNIVELDYNDLLSDAIDLTKISEAFGIDGVGVLTVKNVPSYLSARQKLLPLAREFAMLPEDIKEQYVHADSFYSFGWSHGKEKLQGKPDVSKGSFYANPQYDKPVDDEELIKQYPAFVHPNIWPKDDLPELEHAFKSLGEIIVAVGKLVARQCDRYIHSRCPSYPEHHLENTINTSKCCKARLLHYFPMQTPESEPDTEDTTKESKELTTSSFSSWCGWHNDHGSLTGIPYYSPTIPLLFPYYFILVLYYSSTIPLLFSTILLLFPTIPLLFSYYSLLFPTIPILFANNPLLFPTIP